MQIVSSYGVEIKKKNIPLRSTLDISEAVSYLIPVAEICNFQKSKKSTKTNEAEHLVEKKESFSV